MTNSSHISVTIDFSNWDDQQYDLRIPTQLTVKQLLKNLHETLDIHIPDHALFALKITTKQLLIAGEDSLQDFPVTDGDILAVL